MFSYSPFEVYRCCQHNVSHGWPYYAEELWLATGDRGLCASLYAACDVSAKVGDGTQVKVTEQTDYPFGETVQLTVSPSKAVAFPLYLRLPRWAEKAALKVNGEAVDVQARPLSFIAVRRTWKEGDTVTLQLPMRVTVRRWAANRDAVSVDHGPLSFSLAIQERWARHGDRNPGWPEWEVFPESAWNYGLVLDGQAPARSFEVVRTTGPVPQQPFTPEAAPIRLKAKARKISPWQQDRQAMVGLLQQSPVRSSDPIEEVVLIPMGAARLRISMFPTIGDGPDSHEWVAPPRPRPRPSAYRADASHCWPNDTVEALADGLEPSRSDDQDIPRFTWWDHRGTEEWVQYDFAGPKKVSAVSVYWFDDTSVGSCRVPASWKVLYREADQWKQVPNAGPAGPALNQYNKVTFDPVETTALRLQVRLQPGFSGGILEWKVE